MNIKFSGFTKICPSCGSSLLIESIGGPFYKKNNKYYSATQIKCMNFPCMLTGLSNRYENFTFIDIEKLDASTNIHFDIPKN